MSRFSFAPLLSSPAIEANPGRRRRKEEGLIIKRMSEKRGAHSLTCAAPQVSRGHCPLCQEQERRSRRRRSTRRSAHISSEIPRINTNSGLSLKGAEGGGGRGGGSGFGFRPSSAVVAVTKRAVSASIFVGLLWGFYGTRVGLGSTLGFPNAIGSQLESQVS